MTGRMLADIPRQPERMAALSLPTLLDLQDDLNALQAAVRSAIGLRMALEGEGS